MAWNDITTSDEYKQLSPRGRARLKQRFFEESVLPDLANISDEGKQKAFDRFMETPDDTGEGLLQSSLSSAARGFLDPVAAIPEVLGAYTGIESLEEFGGDIRKGIESMTPINPAQQGFITDAAGVLGQVGQIALTGGAGAATGLKLAGKAASEAAKKQAISLGAKSAVQTTMGASAVAGGLQRADELGLEGSDRLLAGGIKGGIELLSERLGGLATETGLAKRWLGESIEGGYMKPIMRGLLTEPPEEMLAETLGQATDIAMAPEVAPGMDLGNILYAGALGAVGGVAFGGIEGAITPRTRRSMEGEELSATPPQGMTPTQADQAGLARIDLNTGKLLGYVKPQEQQEPPTAESIEADLPIEITPEVDEMVKNVTTNPNAPATAQALAGVASETKQEVDEAGPVSEQPKLSAIGEMQRLSVSLVIEDSEGNVDREATRRKIKDAADREGVSVEEYLNKMASDTVAAKQAFWDSLEDGDVVTWETPDGKQKKATVEVSKGGQKFVVGENGYEYPAQTGEFIMNAGTLKVTSTPPTQDVQNQETTVSPVPPMGQKLQEPRGLPVLPEQQAAQAPQATDEAPATEATSAPTDSSDIKVVEENGSWSYEYKAPVFALGESVLGKSTSRQTGFKSKLEAEQAGKAVREKDRVRAKSEAERLIGKLKERGTEKDLKNATGLEAQLASFNQAAQAPTAEKVSQTTPVRPNHKFIGKTKDAKGMPLVVFEDSMGVRYEIGDVDAAIERGVINLPAGTKVDGGYAQDLIIQEKLEASALGPNARKYSPNDTLYRVKDTMGRPMTLRATEIKRVLEQAPAADDAVMEAELNAAWEASPEFAAAEEAAMAGDIQQAAAIQQQWLANQQKDTNVVDDAGDVATDAGMRTEETQEQPDRLMDVPSTMQFIYQQNLSKTDTENVKKLLEKNEKEARKQGRIQGARGFYESDVNNAIEDVMAKKQDSAEFRKKLESAKKNKDFSQELSALVDSLAVEEAALRGIQSDKGMYGVQWAERNVRTRETNKKKEIRALKERIVALSPSDIALKTKKAEQQVSSATTDAVPTESLESKLPQVSPAPTGAVPTESLPATGQPTLGSVGAGSGQTVSQTGQSVSFGVDEQLLMRSPFTNEDSDVSFRGVMSDGKAVVWTGKTQMAVPLEWLRRAGEPLPISTVKAGGENISAIAQESQPESSVTDPTDRQQPLPLPKTKDALIAELVGPIKEDYVARKEQQKTINNYKKFSKDELLEMVKDQRIQDAKFKRRQEVTSEIIQKIKGPVNDAGAGWVKSVKEIAKANGIEDYSILQGNSRGEEIYRIAARIADRGDAFVNPFTESNATPAPQAQPPAATTATQETESKAAALATQPATEESTAAELATVEADVAGVVQRDATKPKQTAKEIYQDLKDQKIADLNSEIADIKKGRSNPKSKWFRASDSEITKRKTEIENLSSENYSNWLLAVKGLDLLLADKAPVGKAWKTLLDSLRLAGEFEARIANAGYTLNEAGDLYIFNPGASGATPDQAAPSAAQASTDTAPGPISPASQRLRDDIATLPANAQAKWTPEALAAADAFYASGDSAAISTLNKSQQSRIRDNQVSEAEGKANDAENERRRKQREGKPLGDTQKLQREMAKLREDYENKPAGQTQRGEDTEVDSQDDSSPRAKAVQAGVAGVDWANMDTEQRREALLDFAAATASSLRDNAVSQLGLQISLSQEEGGASARPIVSDGSLSVQINTTVDTSLSDTLPSGEAAFSNTYRAIEEEFLHAIHMASAFKRWQAAGSEGDFSDWFANESAKNITDLLERAAQLAAEGNASASTAILDTIYAASTMYWGPNAQELFNFSITTPVGASKLYIETARMLAQVEIDSFTTESDFLRYYKAVKNFVADALALLRESAALVKRGELGEALKRDVAELQSAMRKINESIQLGEAMQRQPVLTAADTATNPNVMVDGVAPEILEQEVKNREQAKEPEMVGVVAPAAETQEVQRDATKPEQMTPEVGDEAFVKGGDARITRRIDKVFEADKKQMVLLQGLRDPLPLESVTIDKKSDFRRRKQKKIDALSKQVNEAIAAGVSIPDATMSGSEMQPPDGWTNGGGYWHPPEKPQIRPSFAHLAQGESLATGVSPISATAAQNSYRGIIPGIDATWIGTVAEFNEQYPAGVDFGGGITTPGKDYEALVAGDGRAFIFTDNVHVFQGDADRAEQYGTTPSVEAIKRLLRHESFGHRGFMALPNPMKQRFMDLVEAGFIPDADFDYLVNQRKYTHLKDWRTNKQVKVLAAEEWLAQRIEKMGRVPQSGPVAAFTDWLKDVWRWLTGQDTDDLTKIRDVMRQMHRALGALKPDQRIVTEQDGERPSYIGEKAQMAPFMRDALDAAKAMAAAGKSSEEIRAVTGWFPGLYDGKMRFELPDNQAAFVAIGDYNKKTTAAYGGPAFSRIALSSISEKVKSGKFVKLSDVFQHNELFDAYPEAANIPFFPIAGNVVQGSHRVIDGKDVITATVTLNEEGDVSAESASTILHELQHFIQQKESFAVGGSPDNLITKADIADAAKFRDAYLGIRKYKREIENLVSALEQERAKKSFVGFGGPNQKVIKSIEDSITKIQESINSVWDYQKKNLNIDRDSTRASLLSALNLVDSKLGGAWVLNKRNEGLDMLYRLLAGEIESRDVEARQNFTPEQRRATAPYSSENIAPEDAIVMFGGSDIRASKVAPETPRFKELTRDLPAKPTAADIAKFQETHPDEYQELVKMRADVLKRGGYNRKGVRFGFYVNGVPLPPSIDNQNFGPGYYVAEGASLDIGSSSVSVSKTPNKKTLEKLGLTEDQVEFRRDNVYVKAENPVTGTDELTELERKHLNAVIAYESAVNDAYAKIGGKKFLPEDPPYLSNERLVELREGDGLAAGIKSTTEPWQKNLRALALMIRDKKLPYDSVRGIGGRTLFDRSMDSELVVQMASQIKSADPLATDDAGNLITPDQWADETSPDIRASMVAPKALKDSSSETVREHLKKHRLVTDSDVMAMLGDFPAYLDNVIDFIITQREKWLNGSFTSRDIAKAYVMTVASQGAGAINVNTIRKVRPDFNPGPEFTYTGANGQSTIRPEEAAAYWLFTSTGQKALNSLEKGVVDSDAWNDLASLRAIFGDDRVNNIGIAVDEKGVLVPVYQSDTKKNTIKDENGNPIPKLDENGKPKMRKIALNPKTQANLRNIGKVVDAVNSSKGDFNKLTKAMMTLRGIGEAKNAFMGHLLGFGKGITTDAVEINYWITGRGDTSQLGKGKGKSKVQRSKENYLRDLAQAVSGQKKAVSDLTERIDKAFRRVRAKNPAAAKIPEDAFNHVMHHWLWDRAKGIETTHAGMMDAQLRASLAPIRNQVPQLTATDPRIHKEDSTTRSIRELLEMSDGEALASVPREYHPLAEKGQATEAVKGYAKAVIDPFVKDVAGLIELLSILRSDERLRDDLRLGPRQGAVALPFIAQLAANKAMALGSKDMRDAFLAEYEALASAGGQNLWGFKAAQMDNEFKGNFFTSLADGRDKANSKAAVDHLINGDATAKQVAGMVPVAGDGAAGNINEAVADEAMIAEYVLQLGIDSESDPELRELTEELVFLTIRAGELLAAQEAAERPSLSQRKEEAKAKSAMTPQQELEQVLTRKNEILKAIREKLKTSKAKASKEAKVFGVKPDAKAKPSKANDTAKTIINKITTEKAKKGEKPKKQPDPVRELYKEHLKKPLTPVEFARRANAAGLDKQTATDLKTAIDREIAAIAIEAQRRAEERAEKAKLQEADAEIDRQEAIAEGIISEIANRLGDPPVPEGSKPRKESIRDLHNRNVREGVKEADFIREAEAFGVSEELATKLWNVGNMERDARDTIKKAIRAIRSQEIAESKASQLIYSTEEKLRQGSKDLEPDKTGDTINKAFRDQVKNPVPLVDFQARLAKLSVGSEVGERLFRTAERENQDVQRMGEFREEIKRLKREQKEREMSEAQASKLIYQQEETLRQGSKDRDTNSKGDTINKAFREQVAAPMTQEQFRKRLAALKVSQDTADRLFKTAERIAVDNEAAELFRRRSKLMEVDSAALAAFVNDLRRSGKLTGEKINWKDLLSLPVAHQDAVKAQLKERVSKHQAFANLSTGEKLALAEALEKVWQRERRRLFQQMIKKADLAGVSKDTQAKMADAMPALLRYINQGMLGTSAFYRALGEKYGAKPLSNEARAEVERLAAEYQKEGVSSFEKQRLAEKIVRLVQTDSLLTSAEILSSFWVTSVLTGGRTQFDMALGVLNGGFSVAKKMIQAMVKTRSVTPAIKGLSGFGAGFVAGAWVGFSNLINPETGLLFSNAASMIDFYDKGASGAGLGTGAKLRMTEGTDAKSKLKRATGIWMAFFERLFAGWDHITVMATSTGTKQLAYALNPKLYKAALAPSLQDYKNAMKLAKERLPEGSTLASRIMMANSLVDDGIHLLGRDLEEGAMESWKRTVQHSLSEGTTASYQEEPTGFGGLIYDKVKAATSGTERVMKEQLDKARVELTEAKKTKQDVFSRQVYHAAMVLSYYVSTQLPNLLGVRFMRFTGNKLNELISFVPIIGMTRLNEKGMMENGQYTLRAQNVRMNHALGTISMFLYLTLLEQLDEDDEERGWIVNGPWENLTPARKSQQMAAGMKPNTVSFLQKDGTWDSYNFVSWPFAGWLAAFGSVSDYKRYTPEKWTEKGALDKVMAAAYSGAFALTDISSLSSLTEMFGRSTYSTDPAAAAQDRVVKGAANFAGGFFPKIITDVDNWFDMTYYKPEDSWGHFAKTVPFYRRNAGAPLRDIFYEPVQVSRSPWSRAMQTSPDDPAYQMLGKLNSKGIWLTPANPENRKVRRGGKLRDLTEDEAAKYMAETGKAYKEFIVKRGEMLLRMTPERAADFIQRYTTRIREIALRKALAAGASSVTLPDA